MPYKNAHDRKEASSRYYYANKDYYLKRNQRYRKEISKYVNEIKEGNPCTDCGRFYPYYVMDFDHLEGTDKIADVNYLRNSQKIEKLKLEIEKCEVVCSNCHRERTHQRLQNREKTIR